MSHTIFCVGSYTRAPHSGRGISVCSLDHATAEITLISETDAENPSYLAIDTKANMLYAVRERDGGAVCSYRIRDGYVLEPAGECETQGKDPCHLAFDADKKRLFAANYSSGSTAMYALDGGLRGPLWFEEYTESGAGVVAARQQRSHAHSTTISPDGRYAFVADLGCDKLRIYNIEGETPRRAGELIMPCGSGPRHAVFSPDGRMLYIVNELSSTVSACTYDAKSGMPALIQGISALPDGFAGRSICADIHMTPDGRFLYASNRGHDSIACYSVTDGGRLTLTGITPVGGKTPRSFLITDNGRLLVAANQDSSNLTVFGIDQDSGALTQRSDTAFLSPVCVK